METLQNLSIPEKKNTIFVSPEPSQWPSLLAKNKLVTETLPHRLKSRRELLKIAQDYTKAVAGVVCPNNIPENIVATGHQAIWHHCGIWAKNLATYKFAEAVNGSSLHLVLDHDVCDTVIVLPKQNTDGSWYFATVEIEPNQGAVPLEFRPLPHKAYIKTFVDSVINTGAEQICSGVWSKYELFKNDKISKFSSIADLITYFQSTINIALGLNMLYLPVSKLSKSDAFIDFALSLMTNAARFVASYNDALTKQVSERKANPVSAVKRLKLDKTEGLTELPFWLILPDPKRTSLFVASKKADKIEIGTVSSKLGDLDSASLSGKIEQLKKILEQHGCRLRPKAISLMLFVRLFLADWFVHGIGGALYEPVTDYIIENYYGIKSLRFGVATCTMTLPLANSVTFPNDNISLLKHKLHDIKHNPEKYLDGSAIKTEPVASLLKAKREQIAQARGRTSPDAIRKSAWKSVSEINEKLFEFAKDTGQILQKKIQEAERNTISQKVCSYREYFFGLFSEEKLRKVAESLTFMQHE